MNGNRILEVLPRPVLAAAQRVAARKSRTSRLLKRVSVRMLSGPQRIAGGPASGLLIDVGTSRPSYVLGTAEEEVQRFLVAHLTLGDSFYDLGANVGYFTLMAAKLVGRTGYVRAYEPLPENAALLRGNVERNGFDQATVVEAAVAGEDGMARLKRGATSQEAALSRAGDIEVKVISLDRELERGARPPTLVKLDVEGAEHDALLGARRTLAEHRPIVLCELHSEPLELDQHPVALELTSHGYRVSWLEDDVVSGAFWAPHLIGVPG
jgi:FkbM family methyltransferase